MYSTGTPFFLAAATISSDSTLRTRGSLAPWSTISGTLILLALNSGEMRRRRALSALGSPNSAYNASRNDSHQGGTLSSVRTQFEIPNRSTPVLNASGWSVSAASTM